MAELLLPLFDVSNMGFPVSVQSLARPNLATFALEVASIGFSLLARSLACLDLLLPIFEAGQLEFSMPVQQFLRVGFFTFPLAVTRTGSPSSIVASAAIGSPVLIQSTVKSDSVLLILLTASVGFSTSLQTFAWLDLVVPALDFLHPGSFTLLRCPARVGFSPSCIGQSKPFNAGLLSVTDFFPTGSATSVRSYTCLGSVILVLDLAQIDLMVSLQSLGYLDLLLFALDRVHIESSVLLQDSACCGSSLSILGLACIALPVFVFDHIAFDFSVPVQSSVHLALALPVVDFAHVGFPSSLQSFSRIDLAVLVFDYLRLGFSLPTQCSMCMGLLAPTASGPRIGLASLVLCNANLGSSLSLRNFAKLGSSIPLLSFSGIELSVFVRSSARSDSSTSVPEPAKMGLSSFLQGFVQLDFLLSILGEVKHAPTLYGYGDGMVGGGTSVNARVDVLSLSILDHIHLDPGQIRAPRSESNT